MTESDRTALEDRLAAMTEAQLREAWQRSDGLSEEAQLIAGACELRDIDV